MYCYQCEETIDNNACVEVGFCGKKSTTADLQDLLVHTLKGLASLVEAAHADGDLRKDDVTFSMRALFATLSNVNFDDARFVELITEAKARRNALKDKYLGSVNPSDHDAITWEESNPDNYANIVREAHGPMGTTHEDVRSLRELLIYGIKGLGAYAYHAKSLGHESENIYRYLTTAMASTIKDLSVDDMIGMVLKCGEVAVEAMALLDKANTGHFGTPELGKASLGVGDRPGILVSGHHLLDLERILKQSEGQGIDIYTHGEMLPAHFYPAFHKYPHLKANYGGSWKDQKKEFTSFNGPIVMTTNCITPVAKAYKDRIYTTYVVGFPGVKHIPLVDDDKDFSQVIEQAKTCAPPTEIETGELVGGFAHGQVLALAGKVIEAIKAGAVKKFIVMAGCDGRKDEREYFTDVAKALPEDTIILTAGCAKYRYNKLDLGDIGGIPRVLDAGQCNDCYSLAAVALALKDAFELDDINDLPIEFDIAWYEQKAVTVLLALLHLGVKGIRLGPALPAFLSPTVVNVLVENFDIKGIGTAEDDVRAMTA